MALDTSAIYTLEEIINNYKLPVYIRKASWSEDFVFRVENIENRVATGTAFKSGKEHNRLFGEYTYGLSEQFFFIHPKNELNIGSRYLHPPNTTAAYEDINVHKAITESAEEMPKLKISDLINVKGKITEKAFITNSFAKTDKPSMVVEEETHLSRIINAIRGEVKRQMSRIQNPERPSWEDVETQGRGVPINTARKEYYSIISSNQDIHQDIDSLKRAEKKPYFAHLAIQYEDENQPIDIFIGERLINNHDGEQVISWQSPLGNLAYDKERIRFENDNCIADVEFKRSVVINDGRLDDVVETYNRRRKINATEEAMVYDEFLMKILQEKRRHKELTNIIPTIQSNQNQIIRAPLKENLVVQGCAGCGKTMILLHRISYLLYTYPGYAQKSYLVLSPSRQFIDHIRPLLTDLRLNSTDVKSVADYYIDVLCSYYGDWNELKDDVRLNDDNRIEPQFAEIFYSADYAKGLQQRVDNRIASYQINEKQIVKLTKEREKLKNEFKDTTYVDNQIVSLKRKRRISIFDEEFTDVMPAGMKVGNRKRPICKAELYATVLLNYYCFGAKNAYPFVFVDEGQDLAQQEYILIRSLNPKAAFNIFGDIGQQIYGQKRSITSWNDLNEIGSFSRYSINENYRNTRPITNFINNELMMNMTALGLDGKNVSFISKTDIISIRKNSEPNERLAIIYSSNSTEDAKPKEFVGLYGYSVSEIKGMEFETVIVFPKGMSDNELYVAFSRALNNLYVCRE